MFKVNFKDIEKRIKIPVTTLHDWKKRTDYRADVLSLLGDFIVLERLAEKDIKLTNAELSYLKDALDNYLSDVLLNKPEDLNNALMELIEKNEKLKELMENAMLNDFLEPETIRTALYKLDKLDKLSRYFLIKERFKEVNNYLKSVKKGQK